MQWLVGKVDRIIFAERFDKKIKKKFKFPTVIFSALVSEDCEDKKQTIFETKSKWSVQSEWMAKNVIEDEAVINMKSEMTMNKCSRSMKMKIGKVFFISRLFPVRPLKTRHLFGDRTDYLKIRVSWTIAKMLHRLIRQIWAIDALDALVLFHWKNLERCNWCTTGNSAYYRKMCNVKYSVGIFYIHT